MAGCKPFGRDPVVAIRTPRSMATVLTLDRTRSGEESCSFSGSDERSEVPADDGATVGRRGAVWSGIQGYFGAWGAGDSKPPLPLPPIGYHARAWPPNVGQPRA